MFIRLYWSRIEPGSWEALRARYVELEALPVPGRLARWVTQDTNDPDSIITVTIWDTQDSVERWESSAEYRQSLSAVRQYQIGSQTVSLCEIKLENPDGWLAQLPAGAGPATT